MTAPTVNVILPYISVCTGTGRFIVGLGWQFTIYRNNKMSENTKEPCCTKINIFYRAFFCDHRFIDLLICTLMKSTLPHTQLCFFCVLRPFSSFSSLSLNWEKENPFSFTRLITKRHFSAGGIAWRDLQGETPFCVTCFSSVSLLKTTGDEHGFLSF